jgi:putative ABC transport system ATP-binding protein
VTDSSAPTATATRPGRAPLLEARDLSRTYHRGPEAVHALREAGISLQRGELVALLGRSGSGKTTLLNVLCGWEAPDAGEVRWLEGDPDIPPVDRWWHQVAIVPQGLGLMEELSVWENVELPVRVARAPTALPAEEGARRVRALLRAFGLDHLARRSPMDISLGEQQRTAVARALVLLPSLLLADEPTGHQDEGWARGVLRLLRLAAARGACCLVATHNEEVVSYADRVYEIADGRLAPRPADRAVGTATRLRPGPAAPSGP